MGESEHYIIEVKNGKLKPGDVLTKQYIDGLKRRKNREEAHQYNRRTTFKVISQDYVPNIKVEEAVGVQGPIIELNEKVIKEDVQDLPEDNK